MQGNMWCCCHGNAVADTPGEFAAAMAMPLLTLLPSLLLLLPPPLLLLLTVVMTDTMRVCLVQDHNHVALPLRPKPGEPARLVTLEVLRRFEFEPQMLLMSGVIARESHPARRADPQVLLKGSPHESMQLVDPATVPEHLDQVRFCSPIIASAIVKCTGATPAAVTVTLFSPFLKVTSPLKQVRTASAEGSTLYRFLHVICSADLIVLYTFVLCCVFCQFLVRSTLLVKVKARLCQ